MGTNWSRGSSIWTWGRTSSLWGWRSTGTGCPGRLWSLPLWRYSRPAWTRSCAAFSRWPCFGRGVGPDDPQRSLPTEVCFFELKQKKDYYCQVLTTEGTFFRKKLYKYPSRFQVTGLLSYLGSFWKPRLLHNLQNFLSVFSPRALLFTRQSCKPENPS